MVEQAIQKDPNWWRRTKERVVKDAFQFCQEVSLVTFAFKSKGVQEKEAVSFVVGKMVAGMTGNELGVLSEGVKGELDDIEHNFFGDPMGKELIDFTKLVWENLEFVREARRMSVLAKRTVPTMLID